MAERCRTFDALPSPSNWTVGALPSSLNARGGIFDDKKKRCTHPIFGPALVLHDKHLVNEGSVHKADGRGPAACGL